MAEELAIDADESVNTFETTIRVLGGLLSAFILSPGDPVRRFCTGLRLQYKKALYWPSCKSTLPHWAGE